MRPCDVTVDKRAIGGDFRKSDADARLVLRARKQENIMKDGGGLRLREPLDRERELASPMQSGFDHTAGPSLSQLGRNPFSRFMSAVDVRYVRYIDLSPRLSRETRLRDSADAEIVDGE